MSTDKRERPFLTAREVATRYGVAVSSVWRWVRDGSMPAPVKLGPSCTRWRLEELETFEASKEVRA